MPPLVLEGNNLGKRHKYINQQVNNAIKSNASLEAIISQARDSDVDHLFTIDVASNYRNVDYIIQVLKSEDMLYVSRAIKKSAWLITDIQYAHIINPQHLYTELFPYMTSRAICKLLLHIRLHLKDEKRVEEFYSYYEESNVAKALKWLPNCSVEFIEKAVNKHTNDVEPGLLRRLCRKCPAALEKVRNPPCGFAQKHYEAVVYLLKTDTDKYLNAMEKLSCNWPNFNKKHTALIMKRSPERVLSKFKDYYNYVHIDTVARYVPAEKRKDFILNLYKNKDFEYWFSFDNIKPFIKRMPKEGKFDFVKRVFIDKIPDESNDGDGKVSSVEKMSYNRSGGRTSLEDIYQWYQHAPFEIAFKDLTKLIQTESSPSERGTMLYMILRTAGRNMDNVQTILQYYHDKHINEPFWNKIGFISSVIVKTNTHKYNEACWKLLDELFHSAEVYIESDNDVNICLEAIIVYKVLHKQSIPEIVEQKFNFNSLENFKKILTKEENDDLFQYLYGYVEKKMLAQTTNDKDEVDKFESILKSFLNLLSVWDKNFIDYPLVHDKIKELIKLKQNKEKDVNLTHIYNTKKSWRKYMFEESLLLSQSEELYINALKHDQTLLNRHVTEVEKVRHDNKKIILNFLSKLKIYWNDTLAGDWANAYRTRIDQSEGHQSLTRGLCALLPHKDLLELLKQYAPDTPKVVWSEVDERMLSLRKHFSKLMYIARPQPPPASILLYAQGDYLQYALPSLNSIFYNLSIHESRKQVPQLLSGPVSLQKHGIRMAFNKLKSDELKVIFSDIWGSSKNATIRKVIFQLTFTLLCREKNESKIQEMWQLLEVFITNLSAEENADIYALLGQVHEVPMSVRAKFCMKSYKFLKTLPTKANCQENLDSLALSTSKLMDTIDPDFVADILLEFIDVWFVKKKIFNQRYGHPSNMIDVICAYTLCTDDEKEQKHRYDKVIKPWLNQTFAMWDDVYEKEKIVSQYFDQCLHLFAKKVRDQLKTKKYVVPLIIFNDIKNELQNHLPVEKNYDVLTFVKLFITYMECYNKIKSELSEPKESKDTCNDFYVCGSNDSVDEITLKITPSFAAECKRLLKEDMDNYFPSIQILFGRTLNPFCSIVNNNAENFSFEKELINDVNFIPGYLLAIKMLPTQIYDEGKNKVLNEMKKLIMSHPSKEVRMHYFKKYYDYPIIALRDTEE